MTLFLLSTWYILWALLVKRIILSDFLTLLEHSFIFKVASGLVGVVADAIIVSAPVQRGSRL